MSATTFARSSTAANRLLLQFARHGGETVCLALEVIENHAYRRLALSARARRSMRPGSSANPRLRRQTLPAAETVAAALAAREPRRGSSCSTSRSSSTKRRKRCAVCPRRWVLVGSAGSGKTAVTLAKLREAEGRVLYVTQSAYLAQAARALYDAHGYQNPAQDADFLSYRELLETLRVPPGREGRFRGVPRLVRAASAGRGKRSANSTRTRCSRSFAASSCAQPEGPLDLPAYLALGGPSEPAGAPAAREAAHALFGRYRQWLGETAQVRSESGCARLARAGRSQLRPHRDRRSAGT